MYQKRLPCPPVNKINKDAVIDDLKRKLAATEYERDCYKCNFEELMIEAHKYFIILESLRHQLAKEWF